MKATEIEFFLRPAGYQKGKTNRSNLLIEDVRETEMEKNSCCQYDSLRIISTTFKLCYQEI